MRARVLTYATHAGGTFNEMLQDAKNHNMHIRVLGWGKPWAGFWDKVDAVQQFIHALPDDDVVIFIDGFDTRIKGSLEDAVSRWMQLTGGTSILMSEDAFAPILNKFMFPKFFNKYVKWRMYGGPFNSGLYMGRAGDLALFLKSACEWRDKCLGDDQCAFNLCDAARLLVLDEQRRVFHNVEHIDRQKNIQLHKGVFCSFPGTLTLARIQRLPLDHIHIFVPEIFGFILLWIAIAHFFRQAFAAAP